MRTLRSSVVCLAAVVSSVDPAPPVSGAGDDEKPGGVARPLVSILAKDRASLENAAPDKPWNARYKLGRDSVPQEGVRRGQVTKHHFRSEKIYPGVGRDYWVYVPKQYDRSEPACLMVFQDGGEYLLGPDVNAAAVFDNLIHRKEMPVTIGLFVNPGDKGAGQSRLRRHGQPELRV